MKFIHTADLHIGRVFYNVRLTDEQKFILKQVIRYAEKLRPDFLVIAGDIYDRAVPPAEAVELLSWFLSELVLRLKIKVIIIAGNHDSPDRLSFGAPILAESGLHVFGGIDQTMNRITMRDEYGEFDIYPIPYLEPLAARELFRDENITDHNSAMAAIINKINGSCEKNRRRIIAAHAFINGGSASESERPLSIGGSESVDAELFNEFDYTALGHLHGPQKVTNPNIQYSGSIMKYSFSECKHKKSINYVEIKNKGEVNIEKLSLTPNRDLQVIQGEFNELIKNPIHNAAGKFDDYLNVRLLDRGPIFDAITELRKVYPNVLSVERPESEILNASNNFSASEYRKLNESELFKTFYEHCSGCEFDDGLRGEFNRIINALNDKIREAK